MKRKKIKHVVRLKDIKMGKRKIVLDNDSLSTMRMTGKLKEKPADGLSVFSKSLRTCKATKALERAIKQSLADIGAGRVIRVDSLNEIFNDRPRPSAADLEHLLMVFIRADKAPSIPQLEALLKNNVPPDDIDEKRSQRLIQYLRSLKPLKPKTNKKKNRKAK